MTVTKQRGGNLRVIIGLLLGAFALIGAACTPPDEGGGSTTTTSTTTTTTIVDPEPDIETLNDVSLEWTLSREMDNGAYNGETNYWSAGVTDGTEATYLAADGDVNVLKKNADGDYVALNSEPAVNWSNRHNDGTGARVTAFNDKFLGQLFVLNNGEGTLNHDTGELEVAWEGTLSVNFYGTVLPFWLSDFKLTVDSEGVGQLTATMQGYGSSIENPDVRVLLDPQENVVVADLPSVSLEGNSFSAPTAYIGTEYPGGGQTPEDEGNPANWGSWPQSFVEYQEQIGAALYYFSSGATADRLKPQEPISVTLRSTLAE